MGRSWILAAAFAVTLGQPAMAQQRCSVSELPGTAIAMRIEPQGPYAGVLYQGMTVWRSELFKDGRGTRWARVRPDARISSGWVLANYVNCLGDAAAGEINPDGQSTER